jgi:hypothetical protein
VRVYVMKILNSESASTFLVFLASEMKDSSDVTTYLNQGRNE